MDFKNLPIKHQLIIMIFAISLVSLWVASTAFIAYDREAYKKSMVHDLTILARILASRSATAVAYSDPYQVRQNLDSLGIDSTIISACVTNQYGEVVALYSRDHYQSIEEAGGLIQGVECLHDQEFISRFETKWLDLIQPVMWDNSQKIGELHMRVDLRVLNKRFQVFTVVMILIILLASLVAIILSTKIQSIISTPLLSLIDMADRVARDNDYSVRATVDREDELGRLFNAFNAMLETIEKQNQALQEINETLEDEVESRTAELKSINRELEAFTYSVSHDLRSPLRSIDGFSAALVEDCKEQLDDEASDYLDRIRIASQRMGNIIDSLLYLSRLSRQDVDFKAVDLSRIAKSTAMSLEEEFSFRKVKFTCPDNIVVFGDKYLLEIVMDNLIGNAWKYTSSTTDAVVEVGVVERNAEQVVFVKDNGVGFDMKYMDKLFGPFQRLHRSDEFEGMGIGLATVARIIHRHHGEIWAEAFPGEGATFYFTLKTEDQD